MSLLAAKISDTAANYLNIFIALVLFIVMPVIITLAYKYNKKMDAVSENGQSGKTEPEKIEAQPAEPEAEPAAEEKADPGL